MTTPDTTICIPAYRAEGFVADAVESVLAQSHGDIRVIISVDPGGDGTQDICRGFTSDPRVDLHVNDTRLGWIGNVNRCLDRIETAFYAFCFHDDRMHPDFVARLRPELLDHPEAVSAAGTIDHFGETTKTQPQPTLEGPPFDRLLTRLTGQAGNAYSLKTLMRSAPVQRGLRLPETPGGYYGDWPFAVAYALAGTFRGVPETLYYKRLWSASVSAGWKKVPVEDRIEAEIAFRAEIIREIQMADGLTHAEKAALSEFMLYRLFGAEESNHDARAVLDALRSRGAADIMTRLVNGAPAKSDPPLSPTDAEAMRIANAMSLEKSARWMANQDEIAHALADAERALALDPTRVELLLQTARLLFQINRQGKDTALSYVDRALDADPKHWQAHLLRARLCLANGDPGAARNSAIAARDLAPPDTPAIAKFLARLGTP